MLLTFKRRRGFTLVEMLVAVTIASVLAAFGVPQYLNAVEEVKAQNAEVTVEMIAKAAKMRRLDTGQWTTGQLGGGMTEAASGADVLVAGKYLANIDWSTQPYTYFASDPSGSECHIACGCSSIACGVRNSGPNADVWSYCAGADAIVHACDASGAPER